LQYCGSGGETGLQVEQRNRSRKMRCSETALTFHRAVELEFPPIAFDPA
jgi:hypothetical protein